MHHDHDAIARLLPVVGQRYVVDVLDLLDDHPRTDGELRAALHAGRGDLDNAIRTLATLAAIRRPDCPGSWDRRAPASTRYELTATGRNLARRLSELDVWTAMYEYYLYGPPHRGVDELPLEVDGDGDLAV